MEWYQKIIRQYHGMVFRIQIDSLTARDMNIIGYVLDSNYIIEDMTSYPIA